MRLFAVGIIAAVVVIVAAVVFFYALNTPKAKRDVDDRCPSVRAMNVNSFTCICGGAFGTFVVLYCVYFLLHYFYFSKTQKKALIVWTRELAINDWFFVNTLCCFVCICLCFARLLTRSPASLFGLNWCVSCVCLCVRAVVIMLSARST